MARSGEGVKRLPNCWRRLGGKRPETSQPHVVAKDVPEGAVRADPRGRWPMTATSSARDGRCWRPGRKPPCLPGPGRPRRLEKAPHGALAPDELPKVPAHADDLSQARPTGGPQLTLARASPCPWSKCPLERPFQRLEVGDEPLDSQLRCSRPWGTTPLTSTTFHSQQPHLVGVIQHDLHTTLPLSSCALRRCRHFA